jgi:hypothetical protein
VRREDAQGAEHAAIERQRRIRVDVAEHDDVLVREVGPEQELRHAHGVGRMTGRFRRRLATLVAVAEKRILDIEVTLAFRDVHGLDHAAARKMDRGGHVRELDEIVQVLERAVPAATIAVVDERRSPDR